jgi:FAD/FMN-containing dehydrogenase
LVIVNRAKVILPGDENFQYSQRIWNAVYDSKKPAIIVQVTGVGDVQACIDYARKVNITVTPRGGGHSWAGFSTIEGGLVIDFILMRSTLLFLSSLFIHI